MSPQLWSRTAPDVCACAGEYRPQLNAKGVLVKKNEPAWRMKEQVPRDKGCLQELHRSLAAAYQIPGYQHHSRSKGAGAGYPDVHLWTALRADGGGGSVYIELKRMGQNPTDVQRKVMAGLQDAGHPVYLTRPCCLLVGVVDEIMAALAGVACRYIEGNHDGPVFPISPASPPARPATHAEPVADAGPRRRSPAFRPAPLPGRDPDVFKPAVGVVVPHPSGPQAHAAILELERWLRQAGFSPGDVRYTIRLITGPGRLHVQCGQGLARAGNDVRVWREGTPAGEFPDHLVDALHADVVGGPSSERVAWLIANLVPAAVT